MSPEEDRTRDAVDSESKHYHLSYSGPLMMMMMIMMMMMMMMITTTTTTTTMIMTTTKKKKKVEEEVVAYIHLLHAFPPSDVMVCLCIRGG